MIFTSITASSPFIETDLRLSPAQMSMFIKGLIYITPCQSRFSRKTIDEIVNEQYTTLRSTIQGCLDDHRVIARTPQERDAFPALKRLLYRLQSIQLSYKRRTRARRERAILKSLVTFLHNRPDVVVRRTDKSKVFYVGNAATFAQKAMQYMIDTEAYQEIPNNDCRLTENLRLVTTLLNALLKRGAINQYQHKKMCPNKVILELGHLHFIPKPHKVNSPFSTIEMFNRHFGSLFSWVIIASYTIATNRSSYSCTVDWYVEISQRSIGARVFTCCSSDNLY